jgi:hypothetical protein
MAILQDDFWIFRVDDARVAFIHGELAYVTPDAAGPDSGQWGSTGETVRVATSSRARVLRAQGTSPVRDLRGGIPDIVFKG